MRFGIPAQKQLLLRISASGGGGPSSAQAGGPSGMGPPFHQPYFVPTSDMASANADTGKGGAPAQHAQHARRPTRQKALETMPPRIARRQKREMAMGGLRVTDSPEQKWCGWAGDGRLH